MFFRSTVSFLAFIDDFLFAVEIAHDVVGAVLGFVVDAADVLADDAQREQLDATQEEYQNHHRGITLDSIAPDERLDKDINHVDKGEHRHDEAHKGGDAQGRAGKGRDAVDGQREQLLVAPRRGPGSPL